MLMFVDGTVIELFCTRMENMVAVLVAQNQKLSVHCWTIRRRRREALGK
jgi:hypothetical protein